jgi:hypothetical protein
MVHKFARTPLVPNSYEYQQLNEVQHEKGFSKTADIILIHEGKPSQEDELASMR